MLTRKRLAIVIVIVISALSFLAGIYIIRSEKTIKKPAINNPPVTSTGDGEDKPIAKVGGETIYQSDLDNELRNYPKQDDAAKKILLDKLVNDSKIMQIGIEKGMIQPANDVFNSSEKDYSKRITDVSQIKNTLENQLTGLKGTIISIWFLNDHVGALGYERAKQVALEKITPLRDAVASGKMTVQDAATAIRNDSSIARLDPVFKTNAQHDFDVKPGEKITWEADFNNMLWQLPVGGVTEIFTGQTHDLDHNNQMVPGYHMFGTITGKNSSAAYTSLDDMVKTEGNKYEVSYF